MGYPQRDKSQDRGRPPFRRDFDRDRGVRRPQMHKAVCSSCGKDCELPFRPTGERPVYCRECFAKNGGDKREGFLRTTRDDRPPFKKFNEDHRPQMMPQQQQHAAPPAPHARHDEQFAAINAKLDRLITLLTPKTSAPQVQNVAKAVEIAEELAEVEKEMVKKKKATKKKAKTSKK